MSSAVRGCHTRAAFIAALFASGLFAPAIGAQADTISGRVIAADSTPIPSARVSTTASDGRVFAARTDSLGRYRIVVSTHGASYSVTAAAFGYSGLTVVVQLPAGSFHATRTFRLNPRRLVLDTLGVRATTTRLSTSGTSPGERNAEGSALSLAAFGIDPERLLDGAALDPGALLVGNGLLSVGGQPPSQNRTSADGAGFGAALPSEGVRGTTLLSNTYDPARGQFSGGEVAARTLSGTNRWGGAFSVRLDDPWLRYGAVGGEAWGQRDRAVRLGGGGGGALIRNRFFVYAALDLYRSSGPAAFLDPADRAGLLRLGLAPDSAARFVAIAQSLGISPGAAGSAGSDFASGLVRFDYTLSDRHSLTVRLDANDARLAGLGGSPLRLAGDELGERSWDAGAFAQLSSGAAWWSNDLRVYASRGESRVGDSALPAAIVRVSSNLQKATEGRAELEFGGLRFHLPEGRRARWELSDELVFELGDAHRIKLAGLVQEERASRDGVPARNGIFTFDSLEDLALGRAASFTRGLGAPAPTVARRYGAFSASDTWRVGERFRMMGGVRIEGSPRIRRPPLDPGLAAIVGDRGDGSISSDVLISPRIGFSASFPGRGRVGIRGGAGLFRGATALAALASAWGETGTGEFGRRVTCIGSAAPVPDWQAFAGDPSAVPSACAVGSSTFVDAAPQAAVFGPSFVEPRVWRGSFGGGGALGRRSWFYLDANVARGTRLASAVDLNRVASAAFTLSTENDRPVYASVAAIDPGTGGVATSASRRLAEFGTVREIRGDGHSRAGQLTAGVGGVLLRNTMVSLGLTLTWSDDRATGVPAVGTLGGDTSGDASRLEWAPSDWDQRLSIQGTLTHKLGPRVRMGAVGRLASGLPFTPSVGGDVNSDGLFNDRAFVFRPGTTADSAVANGMVRLRDGARGSVRACLDRHLGTIAGRNSCRGPWSPSLDAHVEIIAKGDIDSRRLLVTVAARNVTAGLDYLLHGADGLKGWGQYPFVDGTLLRVRGFDPATRAFRYEVNPNFGRRPAGFDGRNAFALVVTARIAVGADPRYQPLEALAEALGVGEGQDQQRIRTQLARRVQNVPGAILSLDAGEPGALGLTPAQSAELQRVSDALRPRLATALDVLAAALTQPGPTTAAKRARIDAAAAELKEAVDEGTRDAHRILTPQQWSILPAWVLRSPTRDDLERQVHQIQLSVP